MRQTGHDIAAWSDLHVADVDRATSGLHGARLTALAHADEHQRQEARRHDADDGKQCQCRRQIIATLNELQVADDCTEPAG